MATTLKDVAAAAGVSITTASRVLNHDQSLSVGEHTRQEIFKVAENLHYSRLRRSKADKRQLKKFAIVQWYSQSQEQDDLYYLGIRRGVEQASARLHLEVTRIFENNLAQIPSDIDGIIALGKFSLAQVQLLQEISDNLVFVDDDQFDAGFDSVLTDFNHSVRRVVEFFQQQGLSDIGLIYGRETTTDGQRQIIDPRKTAFEQVTRARHLYQERYVFVSDFTNQGGYQTMYKAIAKLGTALPQAFFVANDAMATGVLKALQEAKILVPEQVSLVSFNDTPLASYVFPELSSVHVATEDMGEMAVSLLKANYMQQNVAKRIEFATTLELRGSTKND